MCSDGVFFLEAVRNLGQSISGICTVKTRTHSFVRRRYTRKGSTPRWGRSLFGMSVVITITLDLVWQENKLRDVNRKTDANDQAFPLPEDPSADSLIPTGLTKREYFAGLALQGCIISGSTGRLSDYANDAVNLADALIEALNKIKP